MTEKSLTKSGIERASKVVGCEPAMLAALCKKEAPTGGFDEKGRLKILPEKHKIYKYLAPEKRRIALKHGFAVVKWQKRTQYRGFGSYPRNSERAGDARWAFFDKVAHLDRYAVMMGTSYGLGQIMGFNHSRVGFSSVEEMIEFLSVSEDNQLLATARYIESDRRLKQAFINKDFQVIEALYNGGGYNGRYARDFERFYLDELGGNQASTFEAFGGMARAMSLRLGSVGPDVEALQKKLNAFGYSCDVDGIFGQRTEDQVILFQRHNGLNEDGIVGPLTLGAFDHAEPLENNQRPAHDIVLNTGQGNVGVGNVVVGAGGTTLGVANAIAKASEPVAPSVDIDAVVNTAEKVDRLVNVTPKIIEFVSNYGLVVLGAGVVCFGCYQLYTVIRDYRARRWNKK